MLLIKDLSYLIQLYHLHLIVSRYTEPMNNRRCRVYVAKGCEGPLWSARDVKMDKNHILVEKNLSICCTSAWT